jgi:hypothetical protein
MKLMRFLPIIGIYLSALLFGSSCTDGEGKSGPVSSVPKISVESGVDKSEGVVRFKVTVPPGHHAYTDAGDSGNLIPIQFFLENLSRELNIPVSETPALVSEPAGSRDEEFKARVLRGSALFSFKTGLAGKFSGKTVSVRSQICDERSGICYRPETIQVSIAN